MDALQTLYGQPTLEEVAAVVPLPEVVQDLCYADGQRRCCRCGAKENAVKLIPCEAILLFNDQPVQCCHHTCASCALVVQAKTFCGHCEEARRQEEALLTARDRKDAAGSQSATAGASAGVDPPPVVTEEQRERLEANFAAAMAAGGMEVVAPS